MLGLFRQRHPVRYFLKKVIAQTISTPKMIAFRPFMTRFVWTVKIFIKGHNFNGLENSYARISRCWHSVVRNVCQYHLFVFRKLIVYVNPCHVVKIIKSFCFLHWVVFLLEHMTKIRRVELDLKTVLFLIL